jgi:hypothetical protein
MEYFCKIRQNLFTEGPRSPQSASRGRALALHHQEIQLFNEILRADSPPMADRGKRGN